MTHNRRVTLADLGWGRDLESAFPEGAGLVPARIVMSFARQARVHDGASDWDATFAGSLRRGLRPVVGDWVAVRPGGAIEAVLPRRSAFTRRAAGTIEAEQVLAANVDVAFLVMGLDRDFNLRRIERYLALTAAAKAEAVIVLSKADLVEDAAAKVREVEAAAGGAQVLAARLLEETPPVGAWLRPGRTVVLLGSSGAGKSTLLNRILGEDVQRTGAVRISDQRGKHTTSRRQMFFVPGGGLVIDSPGLREIQLWGEVAGYEDIEELAPGCRFRDCRHTDEPGCAVRGAVEEVRLASWRKLRDETAGRARRKLRR